MYQAPTTTIPAIICACHVFMDRGNGSAQMALEYARTFSAFALLREGAPPSEVGCALKRALASYHYHLLGSDHEIGRAFELFVAELVLEIADV